MATCSTCRVPAHLTAKNGSCRNSCQAHSQQQQVLAVAVSQECSGFQMQALHTTCCAWRTQATAGLQACAPIWQVLWTTRCQLWVCIQRQQIGFCRTTRQRCIGCSLTFYLTAKLCPVSSH